MTGMKPLSLSAQFKAWLAWDAETRPVPDCPWLCDLLEPLHVDYPNNAKPYCYGIGEIDFYDHTGNVKLGSIRSHHLNASHPQLLCIVGQWWEVVSSGEVAVMERQWVIKRRICNNTRIAAMLNKLT
jgi:hypothetical protein